MTARTSSSRPRLRAVVAVAALLAAPVTAASTPAPAIAQPAPDPQKRALELGLEAKAYYDQGRWADALAKFSEADAIVHTPVFTLFIARTERRTGKLLKAREHFKALLAEEIAPDAPAPWLAAKDSAKTELAQLEPLIPHATLHLEPKPATAPTITVDGAPAELDTRFEIDPGEHVVHVAIGAGVDHRFQVAEGSDAKIAVPVPDPTKDIVKPIDPVIPPPKTISVYHPGSLVPGGVVVAVGSLGLLVGGITAGLAVDAGSEIDEACLTQPGCDAEKFASAEAANDRAATLGTVSNAFFIGGGIVAAAGIVLLAVRPGGYTTEEPTKAAFVPELRVGPTRVDLHMRW